MAVRGIRGATVVEIDDCLEVLAATRLLLKTVLEENQDLRIEDIASVLFSATPDITSAFPAKAAREIGWNSVPLMSFQEIPVEGSLPYCIRILIHWNTELPQQEIHHVYLGKARILRPDIMSADLPIDTK